MEKRDSPIVPQMVKEDQDSSTMGSVDQLASESIVEKLSRQVSAMSAPVENAEPTSMRSGDEDYISGFKLAAAILSVTLVAFLIMLDTSIIATAIPRITSDFHSLPDVGWYGSAYLLASCALQPSTGKLYTYLNSKWTFLTFLGIFEIGSLLCGVATSSKMFIVGRAVAGMGGSGLLNGALTISAACLPIHKRPLYIGGMMSVAQIGLVLGPLLGGVLTQYTTWRWCFYINLPCGGLIAILLVLTSIPSKHIKTEGGPTILSTLKKIDLVGFALFAPATIQCFLALEWGGNKYPWGDAIVIGLFCGAAATLVVFLVWEYRIGDRAMIPLAMVRQRIVWCSCLDIGLFFGCMMIATYYLPIYFQSVRGATPTLSGVYMLPMVISQMIMALVSGFLVGRLGYYLPWMLASGVFISTGTGLLSTFTLITPTANWIGFQILLGLGRGCGLQMPIIAVQNTLPPAQISVGMSLIVFSQTFGAAILLAVADTDFTSSLAAKLSLIVPPVDVEAIIEAGATGIGSVVQQGDLTGVLLAYNDALKNTFYLGVGAAVVMFCFAWGLGWKSVKKVKPATPEV